MATKLFNFPFYLSEKFLIRLMSIKIYAWRLKIESLILKKLEDSFFNVFGFLVLDPIIVCLFHSISLWIFIANAGASLKIWEYSEIK